MLHYDVFPSDFAAEVTSYDQRMVRVLPGEDVQGDPGKGSHSMEAGLAQFEVSDSETGSSSSFEVLLPDFSSLAISDADNNKDCQTEEKGKSSKPERDDR